MDYAFLVHSRDYTDVQRKFKIAKYFPKKLIELWCLIFPPLLVTVIKGLKTKQSKEECIGYVIGIPMTAKQIMERRPLAQKRIIKAINKAEKLGAKIVGLGALTSSVTGGGKLIKDKVNLRIIPGHAYTGLIVSSYVLKAVKLFNFSLDKINLAIVGASGSIGSICAKYLAHKGVNNFLLIDIERKNDKLDELINVLKRENKNIQIEKNHRINKIKEADIIIAATNAPEAVILPDDLKSNAIIIDDAQPSDISPEVRKQREDVLVVDGGVACAPNVEIKFDFGLAKKNDIYSCLGETIISAISGEFIDYTKNSIDYDEVNAIEKISKELGFDISEFQRFGLIYEEEIINKIKINLNKTV